MSKEYVYIDDSGDVGLKKTNTEHLVVAAVVVVDEENKKLLAGAIDLFRRGLGWDVLHEFKFHKTEKAILMDLIDIIKGFDFKAYAVVLDKNDPGSSQTSRRSVSTYYYVIKELLLRVGANNQAIVIDGRIGKNHAEKVRTYLRQNLKANGIENVTIRFVDSRKDSLVQLADIIAGAVARSYKDKTDSQRYLKLLKGKIVKIDNIKL